MIDEFRCKRRPAVVVVVVVVVSYLYCGFDMAPPAIGTCREGEYMCQATEV